ncbi:unnamed protein product [Polarella glacialis]|uniref:Uncharacterized protein n=1 Tax=Polarella glacialis TaxID=89957 RepID=A0A813G881_POLGL|nr:unnamed protein product [Polarella glacialis]
MVLATVTFSIPTILEVRRECWLFSKANWPSLQSLFSSTHWQSILGASCPESMLANLVNYILGAARLHIPVKYITVRKSTHPWLTPRCIELVAAKRKAEATPGYVLLQVQCSNALRDAYSAYILRTKEQMKSLPPSSTRWWKLSKQLLFQGSQTSSIPPLQTDSGSWALQSQAKA